MARVRRRAAPAAPSRPGTTACAPAAKSSTNMQEQQRHRRCRSRARACTAAPAAPATQQVRQEADREARHLLALLRQRVREVDDPGELGDLRGLNRDAGQANPPLRAAGRRADARDQHRHQQHDRQRAAAGRRAAPSGGSRASSPPPSPTARARGDRLALQEEEAVAQLVLRGDRAGASRPSPARSRRAPARRPAAAGRTRRRRRAAGLRVRVHGASQRPHQALEGVAAVLEVVELVVRGAGRREQHHVAGLRQLRAPAPPPARACRRRCTGAAPAKAAAIAGASLPMVSTPFSLPRAASTSGA